MTALARVRVLSLAAQNSPRSQSKIRPETGITRKSASERLIPINKRLAATPKKRVRLCENARSIGLIIAALAA